MKIKGHQSFHIRRGWIHKGLKIVNENPRIFTDKNIVLTDEFGIGSNMVLSLKYWLRTLGLIEKIREKNKNLDVLTEIGKLIYENDRYLENIETWELLHYKLVTNEDLATTWYWFFNEYEGNIFNKNSLFNTLDKYINNIYEKQIAEKSIRDDINCLLNTYLTRKIISPEDNIESPFSELGLIEIENIKGKEITYKKSKKYLPNLNLLYYIILDQSQGKDMMDLKDIIYGKKNIGKVFNLDFSEVLGILDDLQNNGKIKFIRTAGLNYISINKPDNNIEVLQNLYK